MRFHFVQKKFTDGIKIVKDIKRKKSRSISQNKKREFKALETKFDEWD